MLFSGYFIMTGGMNMEVKTVSRKVGRPFTPKHMRRDQKVNARLSFDTYSQLSALAVSNGTTKSDMIRQLIEKEYQQE